MRSERLLSVMLLLQTHGQLPASELAERLEVSVRTVMRDVEALSAAGVPVYTVRGPHGGIALLPGYRTNVTGLTTNEARALFVLLSGQAHAELGLGQSLGSALRKLMAALPAPHRPDADLASRRILIDPVRWRGGPTRAVTGPAVDLAVLQQAIFTDRRLRLRYRHGRDSRVGSYTLDPYGLVNKAGVWYLVADHRGEPGLFRTDRALSGTVLEEPVRRRDGLELADVWNSLRRHIDDIPAPLLVTVSVNRDILARFLRIHEADLAGPSSTDHRLERVPVELRFRSLGAAEALLAFGTDAEVLAPAELRQALARKAADTAALYATGQPGAVTSRRATPDR
ncbi:helix-turn-helix transcriptional regulator [Nonomuraea guangzhouensis]|uniref:Helix-turn-helix transcriptional regulator n=1 Tax=Nonomuraea guangzhouensis TaxID=1291555 RepID=A0ABW4GD00_9ACTN|nr:YafY family protein [Nonomuraea guangzhouensis]